MFRIQGRNNSNWIINTGIAIILKIKQHTPVAYTFSKILLIQYELLADSLDNNLDEADCSAEEIWYLECQLYIMN